MHMASFDFDCQKGIGRIVSLYRVLTFRVEFKILADEREALFIEVYDALKRLGGRQARLEVVFFFQCLEGLRD